MKRTKENGTGLEKIIILCLTCAIILAAGCQPQQGGGFLKKQVLTFQKVAILPFEGDQSGQVSQCFTTNFKERFPKMEVFDQYRLLQTFAREDLYPNQFSQATRTKIGEILGAQAIVVGNVFSASITSWYLQVRVVDTLTGETLGVSSTQISGMESQGTMQACSIAVQQLMVME